MKAKKDSFAVRIPAAQARDELSDILSRVAYGKEIIIIQRRGKDLAALVPMEVLEEMKKNGAK